MGVKDLYTILRTKAPGAFREITLRELVGKRIAVDASMAINQCWRSHKLTDANGTPTQHLQGLFNRLVAYRASGIHVVFVFDGKPHLHELKAATQERRAAVDKDRPSRAAFDDTRVLLTHLGIPYFTADGEAEAAAAALLITGECDYVATEDSDAIVFGANVLRGLNASGNPIISVDHAEILRALRMTSEQFIQFAILLGTDYSARVAGPVTALKKYAEYPINETVFDYYIDPMAHLPAMYSTAATPVDHAALIAYMTSRGFDQTRIAKQVARLSQ